MVLLVFFVKHIFRTLSWFFLSFFFLLALVFSGPQYLMDSYSVVYGLLFPLISSA